MRIKILVLCIYSQWLLIASEQLLADIYYYEDKKNGVVCFSNVPVDRRYRFKEPERILPAMSQRDLTKYDTIIELIARKYHLDPRFLKAVIKVESDFNHLAISEDGAMGLMQLMPDKARELGVRNVFSPIENLDAGARYLSELLRKYNGDVTMALAAYNAGEEAVRTYQGVPPFAETQQYIKKVHELYPAASGGSGQTGSRENKILSP